MIQFMGNDDVGIIIVDEIAYDVDHTMNRDGTYEVDMPETDSKAMDDLLSHSFNDLPRAIKSISLVGNSISVGNTRLTIGRAARKDYGFVDFSIQFHFRNWNKHWTANEYMRTFTNIIKTLSPLLVVDTDYDITNPRFSLRLSNIDINHPMMPFIRTHLDAILIADEAVVRILSTKTSTDSLITAFDFPDAVKVACEQYLLYFIQFLKDVGVKATAELREEAGQVLFAVTPDDDQEALEKIRQALDVYLRLPANPGIGNEMGYGIEPAAQMLAANIQHLRGQLMMQSAILQAKDATIQAQQYTISQQQAMLSGQVLIQSVQLVSTTADKDDKEDILAGAVTLKPLEGYGFDVNIQVLFRMMRDWFSKDKR